MQLVPHIWNKRGEWTEVSQHQTTIRMLTGTT
jgi:hypothetical protein